MIECISAPASATDSKGGPAAADIAETTITSDWYGSCAQKSHPVIYMYPIGSQDDIPTPDDTHDSAYIHKWRTSSPPKTKLPARHPGFVGKEFGWTHFPKGEPMPLAIVAPSCGVRFDKTPVCQLLCLIRVYPNDDWQIELNLPPLFEKKSGKSKEKDLKSGEITSKRDSSTEKLGAAASKSSSSITTDAKGNVESQSASIGHQNDSGEFVETTFKKSSQGVTSERTTTTGNYLYGKSSTVDPLKGEDEESETEIKPSLRVTRNGSELDVAKVFNSIIHVIESGAKAFYEFEKLLKIVPKVGYTLDLSLTFLEGSLTYRRGYRVSEKFHSDRFTMITPYVQAGGALKVIEAAIEMGIGFEITVPNLVDWFRSKNIFEAIVKLSGAISLGCDLDCNRTVQDGEPDKEVTLEHTAGYTVHLVASANLLGVGIRAEVGIESRGLYITGQAVFASEAPATLTFDVGLAEGNAYGYYFVDGLIWDTSGEFTAPMWIEKPFYKGKWPKAVPQAAAAGASE